MTKEKKLEILAAAEKVIYDDFLMAAKTPGEIEDCMMALDLVESRRTRILGFLPDEAPTPAPVKEEAPVETTDPEPTPEPEQPTETTPAAQEVHIYTKAEVLKLLNHASVHDNVDIGKVFDGCGWENLSAVPPENYGDLIDAVNLAKQEAK